MSQNRLPGSTRGGASAQPTPANNSGGGSGWGDEGYPKGGGLGTANQTSSDEVSPDILTTPALQGISQQKQAAEQKFMSRWDEGHDEREGTCATEDHSFMGTKPGGSDALPGWNVLKDKLGL
ncbi:hypothetical protein AnigIFM60653_007584 [Aspergillus niger]|jgi:hypothetical protein|uniref:Metallopeptidase M24 family protein n=2 Tax=Aspergillus niger TaxID=5061 RepID=A0A505I5B2_ASPNG|nr:hypothetical protein ANI_1_900094 [Aspergillus niger CBS 513.88]XP_025459927.1 uncharacterized protein BO96DRAFT_406665 [Aspergillus niger CBS 101883]EHA19784.1 hypothetical protein ASPNIDRAFT_208909 [Aspergillus niger ATCC 1015]TPR04762.1 Metallopeptidase M24 family protein [Aspergillus niger]PYH61872.1 hypothetical protein BO96DRAFT_406665 [Aspergillus niger CBS 101883]GJP96157.1 metallopeptidase M24 family protein [Aspergillus niger]GKZ61997.1 hypothetical protein AnigIFM49718_009065 [A|eukprot:XP_001394656.2 hypothetical protein ANI_1_900094 [Aspergillus niger CBS 513.88]